MLTKNENEKNMNVNYVTILHLKRQISLDIF